MSFETDMAYMRSRAKKCDDLGNPIIAKSFGRFLYFFKWVRPGWIPADARPLPFAGHIWRRR